MQISFIELKSIESAFVLLLIKTKKGNHNKKKKTREKKGKIMCIK